MYQEIILASNSPRRKELLALLVKDFRVELSTFDESTVPSSLTPMDHVTYSSEMKASSVFALFPKAVVIGADTVVSLGGKIMEKPDDDRSAKLMLENLSGKTHQVYTGITVCVDNQIKTVCECTDVHFAKLTPDVISRYVESQEPMDKAGAYGIQGKGSILVEKIDGCYFNVVGLPLYRLSIILTELNVQTYLN